MDPTELADVTEWPLYLTSGEAVRLAAERGVPVTKVTLANWRTKGRVNGAPVPVFHKLRGGAIAYPRDNFVQWVTEEARFLWWPAPPTCRPPRRNNLETPTWRSDRPRAAPGRNLSGSDDDPGSAAGEKSRAGRPRVAA